MFLPPEVKELLDTRIIPSAKHTANWWGKARMPNVYVVHCQMSKEVCKAAKKYAVERGVEAYVNDIPNDHEEDQEYPVLQLFKTPHFLLEQHRDKDKLTTAFLVNNALRQQISEIAQFHPNRIFLYFNSMALYPEYASLWYDVADLQVTASTPESDTLAGWFKERITGQSKIFEVKIALTKKDYEKLAHAACVCVKKDVEEFCDNLLTECRFNQVKKVDFDFIEENFLHHDSTVASITKRPVVQEQANLVVDENQRRYKRLKIKRDEA